MLLILADDLGYSDLGCYGGEIATPNLDGLAANGLRFTQFYNTARCWSTRAALLTGYYAQQVRFDDLPGGPKRARGPRPKWAPLLPQLLRNARYRNYHSGKWHLDASPLKAGFDRSYSLQDHNRLFAPRDHTLDDRPLPEVASGSDYYATTEIASRAIEFLAEHAQTHDDLPFFAYVAFTAPHFPLQAPAIDVAKYRGRYAMGWDAVRQTRWQRLQRLFSLPTELSQLEPSVGPPYRFPDQWAELGEGEVLHEQPWDQLSESQRNFQAAKMAVHAAMVDRLDQEVGRIIAQLRQMKALENTVVLFLSDNGASAEIMVRGDGHDPEAPAGSAETFLCLGPGWSRAANTPFRRHKTWVHEGGVATPLIVHWPRSIADPGGLRRLPVGHVIDIVPTVLELATGSSIPSEAAESGLGNGPPRPGRSLVSSWQSDRGLDREDLWWYHNGNRAFRRGDWKIVSAQGDAWSLYDLGSDRAENHDLAGSHPELVAELSAA
ncbi:MAG: arylsulfatase, partial [Planctomycetales bacterium]|nr:arylsulfatase [Planctomycetales bacterium]